MFKSLSHLTIFALACATLWGCRPGYPRCESDQDCERASGSAESGATMCVHGLCQMCRVDSDCGDGSVCVAGMCEQAPECSYDAECEGAATCEDSKCVPECAGASDCGDGLSCVEGTCQPVAECDESRPCEQGAECVEGACRVVDVGACRFYPVYFAYDGSALTAGARGVLESNAACARERQVSLLIEGHTDSRGEQEYNVALGEQRANQVAEYLRVMGVDASSLKMLSYGEERPKVECVEGASDACHAQNRRVEFVEQ